MATKDIQEERIRHLNDEDTRDGEYVLYWMQEAQRTELNHALEMQPKKPTSAGNTCSSPLD